MSEREYPDMDTAYEAGVEDGTAFANLHAKVYHDCEHRDAAPSPALTREALIEAVKVAFVEAQEFQTHPNRSHERIPVWPYEKFADAILAALGTPPPAGHGPGADFHEYEAKCRVCGQPGSLYVELRPQRVAISETSAPSEEAT